MTAIEEADLETSVKIAYRDLTKAMVEMDAEDPDLDHIYMYVNSAMIWLRTWNK